MSIPPRGARTLRLGTRKSPMALAQTRHVARLITERTGCEVELTGITTFGDVSRAQLAQIGGTGVFVSALRASLLAGDIDVAVHSLKDLPVAQPDGIALAAVPVRDDPRDALAARDGAKLADLPPGATDRHRLAAPCGAAAAAAARHSSRPGPRQRGHPARPGRVRRGRRGGARLRGPGQDRPARRRDPGLRARRDAARAGPGRPRGGMPLRPAGAGRPAGQRGRRGDAVRPPRPSAACSPRSRQVAAPRSGGMPLGRTDCDCTRSSSSPAARRHCGRAPAGPRPRPSASAARWRPSCSGAVREGIRLCPLGQRCTSAAGTMTSEPTTRE